MLATLADSRLVTVSEGSVEVAHEALLREWPRLREWIEEDGQGRRLRRHLTQAATEWDAAGRDQGELYRGARLAAALDWSADHALELNELERQFVTESREASEKETKRVRRTNRRLRGLLVGVAVLLAAAVAGGIFAVSSAARRATPRPPSWPSASARRRSSRRTSTSRSCSPAKRWRSTTRRRTAATCSPPSCARSRGRDHARPDEPILDDGDRRQPRRADARGGCSFRRLSSSTPRRSSRSAAHPGGRPRRRGEAARVQPRRRHARGRRQRLASVSSTRGRASSSQTSACEVARLAFTSDGSLLVVL